jgi:hypothetical protein
MTLFGVVMITVSIQTLIFNTATKYIQTISIYHREMSYV